MDLNLSKGILEAIDTDRYHAEKKATLAIALPDADAEIEPVPTSATGVRCAESAFTISGIRSGDKSQPDHSDSRNSGCLAERLWTGDI